MAPTTRDTVLADPRSGARPLGNSAPGQPTRTIEPTRVQSPSRPASQPRPASRANANAAPASRPRPRVNYRRPDNRPRGMPSGNYQPIILAEFIGVILAIALAPVAKGESTQGVSPYGGGDMIKLAGATLLFVILGFVSTASQGAARVAAWFGGLTLIAVGLAEGATLSKEIALFTGNLAAAAQGQPSPGSALSQGEIQAGYLQALGQQEAIAEGNGTGAQIWQAIKNAFGMSVAGPSAGNAGTPAGKAGAF